MVATGMLVISSGDSTLQLCVGGLLAVVGVCLMWYAFARFCWRMDRIAAQSLQRIDDPVGPLVLAAAMLIVLLCSAGIAIKRNLAAA